MKVITILWNLNNYCRLDRKKDRDCKLLLKQRQIFKGSYKMETETRTAERSNGWDERTSYKKAPIPYTIQANAHPFSCCICILIISSPSTACFTIACCWKDRQNVNFQEREIRWNRRPILRKALTLLEEAFSSTEISRRKRFCSTQMCWWFQPDS